jgi:hypothetical protein
MTTTTIMNMATTTPTRITTMTTEGRSSPTRRLLLSWRTLGLVLFLGALAGSSFLPTPGPDLLAADSLTIDLDAKDRSRQMWSSVSHDSDGYRELTFEHFNDFRYQPPGGARVDRSTPVLPKELGRPFEDRIPEEIRKLDGQKVAILGFMMPLGGTLKALTDFVLVRNMMICCYGVAPQITEWIMVEAEAGKKIPYHRNIPVVVRGVLKIDEEVEEGFVISLFEMDAQDLKVLDFREFEAYYQRTGVKAQQPLVPGTTRRDPFGEPR